MLNILDGDNNPIDEVEDAELDMEDLDSSMDMVARLFRMSINSGILCLPAVPTKVLYVAVSLIIYETVMSI